MIQPNDASREPPYKRVQVFSGGGSRFGYYLGSYACLHDNGLAPDLILATCGGSLASLLIDIAPDPKQVKDLTQSRELYHIVSASQGRQLNKQCKRQMLLGRGLPRYAYHAIRRWQLSSRNKQAVETYQGLLNELQQLAMFEIANEEYWLDNLLALKPQFQSTKSLINIANPPDIAIIASRLHPPLLDDVDHKAPLKLQEVLFAPERLTSDKTVNISTFKCPTYPYAPERLMPDIKVVSDRDDSNINNGWQISQAVHASMADMYYLAPTYIDNLGWCLGGVIDLTPIELACQLGQTVFAETKNPYDKHLAVPAIKRVFGFDANERLQAVNEYQRVNTSLSNRTHWLPFADNGKALAGKHSAKKINLKNSNIDLVHAPFDIFQQQMQAQWDYGYQRTLNYLNRL